MCRWWGFAVAVAWAVAVIESPVVAGHQSPGTHSVLMLTDTSERVRDMLTLRLRGGGLADQEAEESALRFKVGDRVLAKTAEGWAPGTIAQLMYREPEWPSNKIAPYQIELDVNKHLIYAQADVNELVVPIAFDGLTLENLAMHLATARAQYLNNTGAPDDVICRLMLTTRMQGLPLCRVRPAESNIPGAGNGLFTTRDIAEEELISLFPADAALMWEDAAKSPDSKVRIAFGKHVEEQGGNPQKSASY